MNVIKRLDGKCLAGLASDTGGGIAFEGLTIINS